ncbi:hypothetical protein AB1Y20_003116 [Prymnesium parvum]|uniref:Uncharacterized protein n=1 Tax=Prymnesium parvum TaxID=97485 RepID=A0AB34JAZ1_PRYPA
MARLAVVLYGKLALETQRPHDGVRTSPATVGLSATTWAEAMLAPLGEPIDVFGHCWNPEAAGLLRELWPSLTLPVVCEADVSARMEAACQRRARTAELGRVGCFFPRTCGRTMSHLLGIQRALRLKSAHELRRGRRYRAVLLCRWDVVWWSPRASAWLRGLLRGGNLQLDRFWLPSMCAQEASPGGASRRRVEASFKRAVCGVPSSISIPTLTSSASTQAVDFRGSHWSAMPDARASFFPDWWFVSSSELADGFATIFDLFFNITKVIVHELHRPFVLNRTVNMSSGWRGLYLFGHWYWALHIMQHLRAEVKWAPLEIPREFTLVRHVPSGVENCLPTSAQVTFGANASTVRAVASTQLLAGELQAQGDRSSAQYLLKPVPARRA